MKMVVTTILLVMILVTSTSGDGCFPVKRVRPLVDSILNKRKGMDVTLDKSDVEDLFRLKYGCADETGRTRSVYFSATLSNSYKTRKSNDIIKYNKIMVNKGNAYDPNTGTFTSPFNGTYQFSFSFMNSDSNKRVHGKIALNGNTPFLHAVALEDNAYNTGVGTILYPLKKGDEVQVIIVESGVTIYASYTNFSGMLMSEE